ncbi:MAG: ATP-binding cassette domain-containing protein, partial [Alsobacter sp.]
MNAAPAIAAHGLRRVFRSGGRTVTALDGVDVAVAPGETLAVVGASGSGKTTLARALLRLVDLDAGAVSLRGRDLLALSGAALRAERRHIQMVFQDPAAALN